MPYSKIRLSSGPIFTNLATAQLHYTKIIYTALWPDWSERIYSTSVILFTCLMNYYIKSGENMYITLSRVLINLFLWKTNIYYMFSVCAYSLIYPLAKRMRPVILASVTCLVRPCFSTLSHKRKNFLNKLLDIKSLS